MRDRNFDGIVEKFTRNIYGTTKGDIRQAILWQDLNLLLEQLPARPLRVLDAGGGEGLMACEMALRGHQVIFCDISQEMIQLATQLAEDKGVSNNITFIHCAAQDVSEHLEQPVDLILFHAVLEWVVEPQKVLACLAQCLAPGGALSLMFYNYHGLLMRNMVLGNFDYVIAGMPKKKKRCSPLSPTYPLYPEEVYSWLSELKLSMLGKSGVRVFHDYMKHKQQQQQDFDALLALEKRYCRQEPFVSLGRYIHVMAQKPDELSLKDRV